MRQLPETLLYPLLDKQPDGDQHHGRAGKTADNPCSLRARLQYRLRAIPHDQINHPAADQMQQAKRENLVGDRPTGTRIGELRQ
ncbi:hypothetical protein D3C86_2119720 [compost metagenome]